MTATAFNRFCVFLLAQTGQAAALLASENGRFSLKPRPHSRQTNS
jgi:hypothetical protein